MAGDGHAGQYFSYDYPPWLMPPTPTTTNPYWFTPSPPSTSSNSANFIQVASNPNSQSTAVVTPQAAQVKSKPQKTRCRSPMWTLVEEEILIRIYKEEAVRLRNKGKKGETMWTELAKKLNEECKSMDIDNERSSKQVREKFNNLQKKYKQAKDKSKHTGEGGDVIDECPHFEQMDEFMGSRDIITLKYTMESSDTASVDSPRPSIGSTETEEEEDNSECLNQDNKKRPADEEKQNESDGECSKKRYKSAKSKKKRKVKDLEDNEDSEDTWMAMIRESQKREERFLERMQKSEENFKDLVVGAIRELGSLLKKE